MTVTANSVNRRVELTVSDEGPGIPQRVQGRIFERFYTAETGGGSGPRPGDRPRARAADEGTDLDHLEQTLHRLHPRPAAGRDPGAGDAAPPKPEAHGVRQAHSAARGAAGAGAPRGLRRRLRQRREHRRADDRLRDGRRRAATGRRRDLRRRLQPGRRSTRSAAPGVVTIRSIFDDGAAEGSGFVLDTDGRIVTNAHVVTDDAIERRAQARGEGGLRRVPRPQRRLRRRSSASTRSPTSPCSKSTPTASTCTRSTLGDDARPRRRPAGGGDRQPLRRSSTRSRSGSSPPPTARSTR